MAESFLFLWLVNVRFVTHYTDQSLNARSILFHHFCRLITSSASLQSLCKDLCQTPAYFLFQERKPRDNIVLTFVWDVTKTRNVGSKNKHGEREIEKIRTKQRIGNEVTVPIFHFPVSHSLSPLPVPRSPWHRLRLSRSILWRQNLVVLLRFMAHDSPGYCAQRQSMQRCTTSSRPYIIAS